MTTDKQVAESGEFRKAMERAAQIPTACIGCGHPNPTGLHVALCAEAQRKMREPPPFMPSEAAGERCPHDGQALDWHLATSGTDHHGRPRTNAAFIGCDWPDHLGTPPGQQSGANDGE